MSQEKSDPAPTRGIPLVLDGKTYHLRCSLATRRRLVEQFGEEGLSKLKGDAIGPIMLEFIKGSSPSMTLEVLEDLIDMENIEVAMEAMVKAMGNKLAKVAVGEASPATEAASSAGPAD